MKKLSLVLIGITLITLTSKGQMQNALANSKIHFGVKAGLNVSNVYDAQGEQFNADAKAGLAIGAFVKIPLASVIGIQPEILFSQKGFKATGRLLGSDYSFTRTTNYIDIPLLLAITLSKNLTLLAGPQYSYLIKQKDVSTNNGITITQQTEFKNENIRKNTLCITGGVDIDFSPAVFSIRAGWDLKNNNGDGSSNTPRYKNAWYQLTAGFKF